MKKSFLWLMTIGFVTALLTASASARSFVVPHVLEKQGTIETTQNTFDTTFYFTYTAGLPGVPKTGAQGKATIQIYLYDDKGNPLQSKTGAPVSNPTAYELNSDQRKLSVRIDDLIVAAGGFTSADALVTGFAVVVVKGDVRYVNFQGFVVNSHTGPFDVSVFGFEPTTFGAVP